MSGTAVHPQRTDRPTSGLAVAALVVAFFSGLLGLILGIVARRQVRRDETRGDGLAVAAIVIGAVRLVVEVALGAYLVVGLITGDAGDVAEGSGSSGPIAVGTCAASEGDSGATTTGCSKPHSVEVLSHLTVDLSSDAGRAQADAECSRQLAAFDLDTSTLPAYETDVVADGENPNGAGFCTVSFTGGEVTGSVVAGTVVAVD